MASPISFVPAAEQQHLLFLFLPIKKTQAKKAATDAHHLQHAAKAAIADGADPRIATGVHFFMIYTQHGSETPGLPVTGFQSMPGKDLMVVMSLYDADFAPYISAFVTNDTIALGLNGILALMDESGIVDPEDPTSAVFILANGGVQANPDAFNCLLLRYNFADPTIAAGGPAGKYYLGTGFPGLTIGKILTNYPDAGTIWPLPLPADLKFAKSVKPNCG